MIKIKYERYWNDFIRKNEEKTFADLDALADWIFGQMQQDYTKDSFVMSFPTPEKVKRIKADGPYRIEFKPRWGEESFWIYLIENSNGIIFSDGKFTSGQKHWSLEVQTWLTACEKRRAYPTFNFVEEQPVVSVSDKDAQRTFTVTEMCPHCETEVVMRWNTATMGYKAFCPVCGERLMLCDECRHADYGPCDYDSQSDTCRFNKHE